ncbi:hypothetical protein CEXT_670781 [Caerostris extrusa]|uniref:Uncharacterized protein n=1 Tax=Caerostris extrusa TaxID=172846 RepID=A0AAV4U7G5_CAEEX|nr:hypothetical protein CEXT_670781 [Caerostris extrusa]
MEAQQAVSLSYIMQTVHIAFMEIFCTCLSYGRKVGFVSRLYITQITHIAFPEIFCSYSIGAQSALGGVSGGSVSLLSETLRDLGSRLDERFGAKSSKETSNDEAVLSTVGIDSVTFHQQYISFRRMGSTLAAPFTEIGCSLLAHLGRMLFTCLLLRSFLT